MSKITKIEAQKRNKERVNIYIDEVFAFAASTELVYKQGLKKDEEVNEELISKVVKEDNIIKCRSSALRIIERSYKTEKEIITKLIQKGYEKDEVEKAVDFLKEYNYLNDESYATMYTKDRKKSQGKNKIKYSLIRKGVSEESIESALENINCEEEQETAYNLALKKYESLCKRESDKLKLYNKLSRFLISKGYDYGICKDVVKRVINGGEEWEN